MLANPIFRKPHCKEQLIVRQRPDAAISRGSMRLGNALTEPPERGEVTRDYAAIRCVQYALHPVKRPSSKTRLFLYAVTVDPESAQPYLFIRKIVKT